MVQSELSNYMNKRYPNWLEYAQFHASQSGYPELGGDLLNEVLIAVLGKEEPFLIGLAKQKKNGYSGLDYYILNLIKRNATSKTSPFRYKEEKQRIDRNVNYEVMGLVDEIKDRESIEIKMELNNKIDQIALDVFENDEDMKIFVDRFCIGRDFGEMSINTGMPKVSVHRRYLKILKRVAERMEAVPM